MSDLTRNLIRLTRPLSRQLNGKLARDFGEEPESLREIKRYLQLGDAALRKKPSEQRLYSMPEPSWRKRAA